MLRNNHIILCKFIKFGDYCKKIYIFVFISILKYNKIFKSNCFSGNLACFICPPPSPPPWHFQGGGQILPAPLASPGGGATLTTKNPGGQMPPLASMCGRLYLTSNILNHTLLWYGLRGAALLIIWRSLQKWPLLFWIFFQKCLESKNWFPEKKCVSTFPKKIIMGFES